GVGMMISKPKIDKSQKELDQLLTQMQTSKAESEETIQKAAREIARNKNELTRAKNLLMRTTAQLAKANAELRTIKSRDPAISMLPADTAQQPVVMPMPTGTAGTASTTRTIDYTIKDGDSFWKIAQEQLGDGLRYTEILKLNPGISENQSLTIGMKVKIPAR
ncbi:MAG: LysM peptidoglycan-binding domain-containing protein, partial [Planctomycetes bacterium]|nr:LysM peptidoglycan-binding domain-containing protein [Planctomycetota bacterium]